LREKLTTSNYPSKNVKCESYYENGVFITKNYYDDKRGSVRELISLKDTLKEIKYFTPKGVSSMLEYYLHDKRDGLQTKYFIPKANKSIKSTKTYSEGKLHGECITYNDSNEIIKQEVYALGKIVLKYLRTNNENNEITSISIVDKENVINLPTNEYQKLQQNLQENAHWFTSCI
jgi:antitoxin component YwqK of YwqJK toxin-antitoxin module